MAKKWGTSDASIPPCVDYRVGLKFSQFADSDEGAALGPWNVGGENSVTIATAGTEVIYDGVYERPSRNEEDIRALKMRPTIIPTQIFSLPSEKYKLRVPVDVILEIYADETLALLPELTLCGEGGNEFEAIDDLKTDIVDLLEDLEGIPEADLGEAPKLWKRSLELMVERCQ